MSAHGDSDTRATYYTGVRRVRYVLNWLLLVPLTVVLGAAGTLVSFLDRRGRATHGLARVWGRLILVLSGMHLQTSGLDELDPDGAYVFVCNHHSALDIPVLLAALPFRVRMLAKASLFRIPFLGWYIGRVGYVPVDRDDPRAARRVLRTALEGTGRGASLLVFPSGTRTPEGDLGDFKRGAVFLARETGLPIVPVALVNTGNLLPRGGLCADPGVVEVRVGTPVDTTASVPTRGLARTIREEVLSLTRRDAIA